MRPPLCGQRVQADASVSVLVLTGRGSFRPIQSSLTKAALSRPIVPKALPPQAPGHLASKFLSSARQPPSEVSFLFSCSPCVWLPFGTFGLLGNEV